jgi:hypothetical protein
MSHVFVCTMISSSFFINYRLTPKLCCEHVFHQRQTTKIKQYDIGHEINRH